MVVFSCDIFEKPIYFKATIFDFLNQRFWGKASIPYIIGGNFCASNNSGLFQSYKIRIFIMPE